jgi:hypothetical protein
MAAAEQREWCRVEVRLGFTPTGTALVLFQRESRSTVRSHPTASAERWLLARAVGRVQLGHKREQQLLTAAQSAKKAAGHRRLRAKQFYCYFFTELVLIEFCLVFWANFK